MSKKIMLLAALLCALLLAAVASAEVQVGEFYVFGTYEQDNDLANGAEPIEWRVLQIEGNEALLISKFVLDTKPYNEIRAYSNWSKCTLRPWLNTEFYDTAFTDEDKAFIQTKTLYNRYDVQTTDTVFLLDNDQAKRLFAGFAVHERAS